MNVCTSSYTTFLSTDCFYSHVAFIKATVKDSEIIAQKVINITEVHKFSKTFQTRNEKRKL